MRMSKLIFDHDAQNNMQMYLFFFVYFIIISIRLVVDESRNVCFNFFIRFIARLLII